MLSGDHASGCSGPTPSKTAWCHGKYNPRGTKQPVHKPLREEKTKFSIEREESILTLPKSTIIKYLAFDQPNQTLLGFPSAKCPTRPFFGFDDDGDDDHFSLGPSLEVFN